jgi:chromosomal replication initiator protein
VVLDTLWQEFLKILCAEVGSRVVETWFKAVSLVRWDAHTKVVYLRAPNVFVRDWIDGHYQPLFKQHLGRLLNEVTVTVIFIDQETTTAEPVREVKIERPRDDEPPMASSRAPARNPATRGPLAPQHQFDTFVVGPSNALAFAAAHAVTEDLGGFYNPLLIWGNSGLGKTHLLQAIGNRIRETNKKVQVLYQSADRFVNEFIAAVRTDRVHYFESRYKGVDVLLMDDIQCMSHKEQTQEIFFQIFNSLHSARKQVVCSSNILPGEIGGLSDRIRSRIEGGMVADLQAASLETRIQIVHNKARAQNINLHDDIAYFIAARTTENIRDLEGGLIRVLAFSSLTRQPVSLELAHKVLARSREPKRAPIDLQHILKHVARSFDYSIVEIRSPKRSKDLTLARHVSIYLMKKLTDKSLREIALCLERKDHSTILHALSKIQEVYEKDIQFASLLDKLERELVS